MVCYWEIVFVVFVALYVCHILCGHLSPTKRVMPQCQLIPCYLFIMGTYIDKNWRRGRPDQLDT